MPTANCRQRQPQQHGMCRDTGEGGAGVSAPDKADLPFGQMAVPCSCPLMFSLDATIKAGVSGKWRSSSPECWALVSGTSNGRQTFIIIFVQHFVSPGRAQTAGSMQRGASGQRGGRGWACWSGRCGCCGIMRLRLSCRLFSLNLYTQPSFLLPPLFCSLPFVSCFCRPGHQPFSRFTVSFFCFPPTLAILRLQQGAALKRKAFASSVNQSGQGDIQSIKMSSKPEMSLLL